MSSSSQFKDDKRDENQVTGSDSSQQNTVATLFPNLTEVEDPQLKESTNDDAEKQVHDDNPTIGNGGSPKSKTSLRDMVVVNIDDVSGSKMSQDSKQKVTKNEELPFTSRNNNCMALLPFSGTNQLVPLAILGKATSPDESHGGIMQLITGTNKVSPETTTVGAVLMLIPKKSDTICVDMMEVADVDNNDLDNRNAEKCDNATLCENNANAESDHGIAKPCPSYDSYEEVCRICHDNPSKLELISPCLCKGSMSKVHRTCLERWLGESAKNSCEICGYEYNTVRKPKYTGCWSVFEWIRHPLSASDTRNLFFDIACFFILTPLAIISSWLCVVGAQHYSYGVKDEHKRKIKVLDAQGRNALRDASNATWTSVGLLSLTGTLLAAYYIWLFVAIRYHIQIWRDWQQRNFIVNIVPFEDGCMGRPPQPRSSRNPTLNNNRSDNNNFEPGIGQPASYSHNAIVGIGGGRNLHRSRYNRSNNLPAIFSRSRFLQNPPPGYTVSETTLLYQALYGSDSDTALLNENLLAFIADSSDDIRETESSSLIVNENAQDGEPQIGSNTDQNIQQQSDEMQESQCLNKTIDIPSIEAKLNFVKDNGTAPEIAEVHGSCSISNLNLRLEACQRLDASNENASAEVQDTLANHTTVVIEDNPDDTLRESV